MGSIGAMLGKQHATGELVVREVPRDMEADRAGLRPGDHILLINGRDARHMTADEVHDALVGPIGSAVDLTIERDGRVLRLRVRRGALK
jgi:C-terminal processing protease CtpA/Prc